jgi:hypothetical protein
LQTLQTQLQQNQLQQHGDKVSKAMDAAKKLREHSDGRSQELSTATEAAKN